MAWVRLGWLSELGLGWIGSRVGLESESFLVLSRLGLELSLVHVCPSLHG